MISLIAPALLAFLLASVFSWWELVTSKYPRTRSFVKNCRCLYGYALIYGGISFAVMLLLNRLTSTGVLQLGVGPFSNPWIQAVAVGLATKALLHIRLFTVNVGSQAIPVGIETIVQVFEPTLLQCVETHEFNGLRGFLNVRAHHYSDLESVKERIRVELPPALAEAERKSFELDLKNTNRPIEALELYFRRFGKASVERVFPLRAEPGRSQACLIKVTSPTPEENARIPLVEDDGWVSGTARIPDDRFLWLLLGVEELPGWWWPQGGHAIPIKDDGKWELFVYYGQPGEISKFEILVIAVDSRTNRAFDEWYRKAEGNYSPTVLPNPVETYPGISLTVGKKPRAEKQSR